MQRREARKRKHQNLASSRDPGQGCHRDDADLGRKWRPDHTADRHTWLSLRGILFSAILRWKKNDLALFAAIIRGSEGDNEAEDCSSNWEID